MGKCGQEGNDVSSMISRSFSQLVIKKSSLQKQPHRVHGFPGCSQAEKTVVMNIEVDRDYKTISEEATQP